MPDFNTASDDELRASIAELQRQAHRLSYERRLLHGRIAVMQGELDQRRADSGR